MTDTLPKRQKWLEHALQGLAFWIGHRHSLFKDYPLSEGALVAEACNLIQANLPHDLVLMPECMYKNLVSTHTRVEGVGNMARADMVLCGSEAKGIGRDGNLSVVGFHTFLRNGRFLGLKGLKGARYFFYGLDPAHPRLLRGGGFQFLFPIDGGPVGHRLGEREQVLFSIGSHPLRSEQDSKTASYFGLPDRHGYRQLKFQRKFFITFRDVKHLIFNNN